MPVSRDAVIWAYKIILGREPESDLEIKDKMQLATNVRLAYDLLHLEEFTNSRRCQIAFSKKPRSVYESKRRFFEIHSPKTNRERITQEAVIWSYRFFLGREPESNTVIKEKIKSRDMIGLIRSFVHTEEFAEVQLISSLICQGEEMSNIKVVMVDIGGKNYTITSDDYYLEGIKNGFEPDMVALFKTVASNSEVILDVGANIGCTAILFGNLSNSVYAFEPSPTTFKFLEKNILMSGLQNVFPQNMGLGIEPGEFTLTFHPSNRSGGFVSNLTQAGTGHTIEKIVIRQMDEVLKTLNPSRVDFIKIDVEGFEGHVLRGATQTLSSYKPNVVMELNHWCLNAFQRTSIPDFFDLLRSLFPILLAVDGSNYLNLHNESDSYIVMYHHILHMRFPNILAAFDENRLDRFRSLYKHDFIA